MGAINFLLILFMLSAISFYGLFPIQNPPKTPLEIYFVLIVLAASAAAGFSAWKSRRGLFELDPFFFGFILIGALLRYLAIDIYSVWLDEETQFFGVLFYGLSDASAHQQQMPFSYLFSATSQYFFGAKEFAPRFFPAVFGSVACGVFYLMAKRLITSKPLVIISTLFFTCSPWLVRYSVEGRPLSLTVLAGLIFLYVVSKAYDEITRADKPLLVSVFVASFVLIGSTFFQNFIFLLSVNIAFFLILRPKPRLWVRVLAPQALALIIWAPQIWELLSISIPRYGHSLEFGTILSAENKFRPFYSVLKTTWFSQRHYLWITLPLLVATLFHSFKFQRPFHKGQRDTLAIGLVFISIFSVAFYVLVSWKIVHRYSLINIPVLILLIFCTLEQVKTLFSNKLVKFSVLIVALAFVANNARVLHKYQTEKIELARHADWNSLYQALKKYGKPGDLILGARFDHYFEWRPAGPYSERFYLDGTEGFLMDSISGKFKSQAFFLRDLLSREDSVNPGAIFLIHIWNAGYKSKDVPPEMFLMGFNQVALMGTQVKGQRWPEVLLKIIRSTQNIKGEGQILTWLQLEMEILMHLGRKEKAREVLSKLKGYLMPEYEPELYRHYENYVSSP